MVRVRVCACVCARVLATVCGRFARARVRPRGECHGASGARARVSGAAEPFLRARTARFAFSDIFDIFVFWSFFALCVCVRFFAPL